MYDNAYFIFFSYIFKKHGVLLSVSCSKKLGDIFNKIKLFSLGPI